MLHLLAATNRHCWQHVCAFATAAAATTASAVSTTHLARHLSYYATAHQADASAAIAARSSISRRWSAAGAAAAAALLWGASTASPALADAADGATPSSSDNSSSQGSKQARFTEWLTGHGADMSAVAVHPSSDQQSGLGLFATQAIKQHIKHSWLGRRLGALVLRGAANQTVSVATIPFKLALTVESAVAHPLLGQQFGELLELGLIDERTAVVVLLLVERARGEDSAYAPWLQLLPARFSTPLFYSNSQLQELSGTTLAAATAARQAALNRSWQQLQPEVQQMYQLAGIAGEPSFEDFLWATSIFWSRGLALPLTYTDTQPAATSQQQEGGGSSGGTSSGGIVRIKVLEGLVPGLDFANHSEQPKCWWEVDEAADSPNQQQQQQQQAGAPNSSSSSSHVVRLMANRACCPAAGEELTISYGDKGNEELLLLYGFAVPQNPHETLMVLCPLPAPEDWDETFTARMHLLQARGLRPQLFLSASHFEAATGQRLLLAPVAPVPESDGSSIATASDTPASSSSSRKGSPNKPSIVPQAARQVLEVFVLDKRELAEALQQQQEQEQQGQAADLSGGSSGNTDPVQQRMQQLGLDMAVLTTFARLLELKMIGMEGEEGTGALEGDLQQLAALEAAQDGSVSGAAWLNDEGAGSGGAWRRHCLVYRAGQKALVRSYIAAARAELQETLAELQALMEASGVSD